MNTKIEKDRKTNLNKMKDWLRDLKKCDAFTGYIDCPACGGERVCHQEVTKMELQVGEVREILSCRSCGYIRDSHFRKDGTAKIKEPPVFGIYYIEYKDAGVGGLGGEGGPILEEITEEHISRFKKVLEDPRVDKNRSYFKLTRPRKVGP